MIGVTGLSEFSLRDRRAVVGTWHGREWWGKGANRSSKTLVLALAFEGLRARAGDRLVRQPTTAARRRRSSGSGSCTRACCAAGTCTRASPKDVISYSMLRSEWESGELSREPFEIAGDIPVQFLPL